MAITLQNINVLGRSYSEVEVSERAKMARFTPWDCWNFQLIAYTNCGGVETMFTEVFFAVNFAEPKYVKEREFIENGFGKKTIKRSITKREYSFDFLTDDNTVEVLHTMYSGQVIKAVFETSATPFIIDDFEIEQKQRIGDMQLCTIKFKDSEEDIIGQTKCCDFSVYQDAPFQSNCPPTNGNLILATDDAEAGTLGVLIGQYYELDYDNPYGASQGILKVRKT